MTARILLAIAVTVSLATPTAARAAKLSKSTRDVQSLPEPARPKPSAKPPRAAAPRLTVEEFVGEQRARIQNISDKQIVYLQRLIALTSEDDPQVPDYRFRLGDLQSEKHRYLSHRARSHDEPIFRAEQARDATLAAQHRRAQAREQQQADKALREAIGHFLAAAKHPRYQRMDEVLYRLGYLLESGGLRERASEVYHRLLKQHPGSRYVPHAYLSFAEHFFAEGDMAQALAFYDKVAQLSASSVFGFALYKKAWSQVNLGEDKAALATFVALLGHCQAGRISQAQRGPLEREARRDLVRVFARTAAPERAWDFFVRLAGSDAPRMMRALAESYWEEGMADSSSRVYRKLMMLEPRSPMLCAWQDKVLRNTLSAGREPDQVQELRRLGTSYRYLHELGIAKAGIVAECRERYRDAARELAFVLHKQAQRLKQLATYQLAATAYRELLGSFAEPWAPVDAAFYFAECLWQIAALSVTEQALWREAAEQYTRVVHRDPHGRYVKEAAYAAILAWQNVVYDNGEDLHPGRHRGS